MIIKKLLGEILVDMGLVNQKQLDRALKKQKKKSEPNPLPERLQRAELVSKARVIPGKTPLLGQILTDLGFVTKKQIDKALKKQDNTLELYKTLENKKLGAAIEIGSMVNSTLNLAEVLALIMEYVNQVTNSDASTLMLLDEKTGELVFSVPTGPIAGELIDIRIPPGEGIAGWVAKNQQPVLAANAREDPIFYSEIDKKSGRKTKSILCVPLKAKTRLIGVLEAVNKSDGSAFTKEDALFLSIFAHQAAVAIENARLYGELKDQMAEARQMQTKLARSEKFQALGQMASGVAHDFNNILSGIMGYAEMALYDISENSPARKSIEQVLKASNRAEDLVKQILAFSRQSESDQERRPIQIHHIVQEALKLTRASLPTTIDIHQDISTHGTTVLADPTQIHQILMNLCTNAHHAMREKGGILEVSLVPVELDSIEVGDYPD